MVIFSIANAKGGVGKTTFTINLAGELSKHGKVLLIDNDPQCNITQSLLPGSNFEKGLHYVYVDESIGFSDIILSYKENENIFIAPNSLSSTQLEYQLINHIGRESILTRKAHTIPEDFDFVLIDNMPFLGTVCLNGILLSDYMISVIDNSDMSIQGLTLIDYQFRQLQQYIKPSLRCIGVVRNNFDKNTNYTKDFNKQAEKAIGSQVFETIIYKSVRYKEAISKGKTVQQAYPEYAKPYTEIVKEIFSRLNLNT